MVRLATKKLAPITSLFTVAGDDEAMALSRQLLDNEGIGHTAIIHTHDQHRIDWFSREMPASRILVNAPGAQGTLGASTGLTPSMTLGTGTLGGTSTNDSVTYIHLLNIKRVVYGTTPESAPPVSTVGASNGHRLRAGWTRTGTLRMRWITRDDVMRAVAIAAVVLGGAFSSLGAAQSNSTTYAQIPAPVVAAPVPTSTVVQREACGVTGALVGDGNPLATLKQMEATACP
jgi:hypothetical protein